MWHLPNLLEAPGLKALPAWFYYNVHFQVICDGMRLGLVMSALLCQPLQDQQARSIQPCCVVQISHNLLRPDMLNSLLCCIKLLGTGNHKIQAPSTSVMFST